MGKSDVLSQLWAFLKYRKKYWLMPIVFLLVLTPLGFVLRLFGRDELRRRGPAPESMWTPYPVRNGDPRHYETIW